MKIKSAICQLIEYDISNNICMIEVATSVGLHYKMLDLSIPSERFEAIILKQHIKENLEPWNKGCKIKVVLDDHGSLLEICPPTIRKY